jgi:FkbM family methyltransferase
MNHHHPIFSRFEGVKSVGTGRHVFDFIGSATDSSFKRGWDRFALGAGVSAQPPYPTVNEHYFDWIATLLAVDRASGVFRMAELGAGWAPWIVRAALASRQRPNIERLELVAVEADEAHFNWVLQHLHDNAVGGPGVHVMRGALSDALGKVRFPKIDRPDEDYGASTRAISAEYIEVPALTLADVLGKFSGPVDFLHVDIQGAEYEVIPPSMSLLRDVVKTAMVGTHISLDDHHRMVGYFREHGWREICNYDRNALCDTAYGQVQFGDGFVFFENPKFFR